MGNEYRLIAAASAVVPPHERDVPAARIVFLAAKLRELWSQGNFRGRRAVFALPAASMYLHHLRLPRMDEESITKAIPWELQGKVPIDPSTALLRHLVAGEVYHDQVPCQEVIVFAARREAVDELLSAAHSARLDIAGINVESRALLDCFLHVYRRKTDADATNLFIDIGARASRAIVARGGVILFARNLPVGGDHFCRAVSAEFSIPLAEARQLRRRLALTENDRTPIDRPAAEEADPSGSSDYWGETTGTTAQAITVARPVPHVIDRQRIEPRRARTAWDDCRGIDPLSPLPRGHFSQSSVERLIFVGGEACQRNLCQRIARKVGIGAQIGDPLVRMGRTTEVGIESGIDRRLPQPGWAVAIGLSMGSTGGDAK